MAIITSTIPFALIKLHYFCASNLIKQLCNCCYIIYFFTYFAFIVVIQSPFELLMAVKFAHYAAAVVLLSKLLYAYRECTHDLNSNHKLTLRQFIYFMLAPVLICKWDYRRSKLRDYPKIARLLFEFCVATGVATFTAMSFWRTMLSQYGNVPLTVGYVLK